MSFKEKAKEHNLKYIQETDIRVNKPNVFFHQDNFNKKLVLPNNWVLESDNLETMLDTPNDVALYSWIYRTMLTPLNPEKIL